MLFRFVLFLLLSIAGSVKSQATSPDSVLPGNPCHGQVPCTLDGRSYHVKEPDGWDGVSALPVMLHFHGWGRTGAVPVYHGRISGATRRRGVLLIAPTGVNRTWDFWSDRHRDVAFATKALEDAARRYPIDTSRIFVSGYSFGAAMAWRYACQNGNDVAALLAVSGTLNQRTDCPQGPKEVRHVHGLSDNVMDYPFGPDGDRLNPVALWRAQFGCGAEHTRDVWSVTRRDTFTRHVWTRCAAGKRVILDVHPRGHFIPRGWIGRQLDELLGRAPGYP
ncbi:alpha/beta hydrolase family esterase [Yoonia sediminilitoris]|uniref:Polyhydroxybutyrate depolymerase n=1 Tax=Yoonia sediminilitoris TaxID=1286148 RepID=A0A2T6KIG1_9RHOB|nr:polyhydroxybutyrate depolymerase [Yoonia sediminilitoris]PUB15504.1 polyhydroxybutyrate depolymerase [Yoonia sediminilitoris]RCW96113.1 polyhydroxybutyrate depolymerase [Yoonia sediminilitoris]